MVSFGVSVFILTANRSTLLERLLKAVTRQLSPADEIIVLDTNPNKVTGDVVNSFANPQVRYVPQSIRPFSFAVARNELLKLASHKAAVFIDDDAVPFPGWLAQVRCNLSSHVASGGVTVSNAELPGWWDPAINWCVGISPPGMVEGAPGFYPDTCNMAARQVKWESSHFCTVEPQSRQLYASGREDADWWMERRREGEDVVTCYQQAVVHEVHSDRLSFKYVVNRAQMDGESSWFRRPYFDTATAIPWDFAHICGVVLDKICRHPLQPRRWINDYVWMNRQWGVLRAVWKSPVATRPRHRQTIKELAKATAFQGKIRASNLLFRTQKRIRHRHDFPAQVPHSIFVSADCLLGDSILLRPHIHALAKSFPLTEVIVSARTPQLLSGLSQNVTVMPQAEASAYARANVHHISAAFIPYFYGGDYKLWRNHLSPVGSTFNCDVGFHGRRDYVYARRPVVKNMELHEHENLARLFRLWSLAPTNHPDPPPVTVEAHDWIIHLLSSCGIDKPYIVVQLGAGYASKEWPVDCWRSFLQRFIEGARTPVIFIGTEAWYDAAESIAKEFSAEWNLLNLTGKTNVDQLLAVVSRASFFVGGCSGPKHVAMEYRVPTFTLYSATEPERWGASRDHELHAYVTALPQKLTAMELHGLLDDHRPRLLNPDLTAEKALEHYQRVKRQG